MAARHSLPAILLAVAGAAAGAQATPASAPPDTGRSAPSQPVRSVALSGVLFGNYQYHTHPANRDFNQFLLERAYLTARATLGRGLGARATTDVYQSGDQNGWSIRLKYGYLQYDRAAGAWGSSTRAGMLQTVVIEHIEQYWPRWLSPVPTDRSGYHASADVGVAQVVTLPRKWGEVYGTIVNGGGYTRRETDRFKDLSLRLTLTPLASSTSGLLSTLALTGWVTEGASASRFAQGGAGQVGAVREGQRKDRYGAFVGLRDPRLTLGAEYAVRHDVDETGANTVASPRVATDVRGTIRSGFAVVRPFAFVNASGRSRLGLVGRYDDVTPGTTRAIDAADERTRFLVAGLIYDVLPNLSLALDYQEQHARRDLQPEFKTWYGHFQLTF